jgi:hypothetical protein
MPTQPETFANLLARSGFADVLAQTMATLEALGKTKVGKDASTGARDELAREIMGILNPDEAAEMLANVSLFLALTEK